MTAYQPGIPTGTVKLDVDYQNLQGNFQQLDTSFKVDHIPLTQAQNNGYHTVIHQVPFSTTASNPPNNLPPALPPASPGVGKLFSIEQNDGFSTDTELYYITENNKVFPMTRNIVPLAQINGRGIITGGLVMQWGRVNPTSSGLVSVTFPVAFPFGIYNVQVTATKSSSVDTVSYYIVTGSISTTGFDILNTSGHTFGYSWLAIGN